MGLLGLYLSQKQQHPHGALTWNFKDKGMPVSVNRLLGVFAPFEDSGDVLPTCAYFSVSRST